MSDLPALPEGLGGPDYDVRMHDLRAADFDSGTDLLREVIRNVEKVLDTRGWDQPDWIAGVHAKRGDPANPAYIWLAEMSVPKSLHGDLSRILPSLAAALNLPIPGTREQLIATTLGEQPDGSWPIGVVVAFETWGVHGTGPIPADVAEAAERGELSQHPDGERQRHVLTRMGDGTLLHLVRVRDQEAFFVDEPGEHLMTELLGVVVDAICGRPMAQQSLN